MVIEQDNKPIQAEAARRMIQSVGRMRMQGSDRSVGKQSPARTFKDLVTGVSILREALLWST